MAEENKTILRLEIDKTIQPRQFEPIKIIVDVEETFYWKEDKDRKKKMDLLTDKMAKDFVSTFNQVIKIIGEESRCIGNVIINGEVPVSEKNIISSDDEEFNFE